MLNPSLDLEKVKNGVLPWNETTIAVLQMAQFTHTLNPGIMPPYCEFRCPLLTINFPSKPKDRNQ